MVGRRALTIGVELDGAVETALADAAVTVVSVATASSARERLRTEHVDAVLTAQELPDTDGLTLIEELRDVAPSLPVVLSPADGSETLASAAMAAGVTDYVPRSVARSNPDRLVSSLERNQQASEASARERRLTALHGAVREMDRRDSTDAIAQSVVDAVTATLGRSCACVYRPDDQQSSLTPVAWTDSLGARCGEPPTLSAESPAWSSYADGELVVSEDHSVVDEAASRDTQRHSDLLVPLGEHGVLVVSTAAADTFDSEDVKLGRLLGTKATAALGRVEQDRELRSFKRAVESSGHGIVITDTNGTIEYANPAFEEITGYGREEIRGENPRVLNSGEHDETFYREMWETILAGDVWHSEIVNEDSDGDRIVLDQTIAPITGGGEIERFVAINRDVTERADHQQRVEEQRDELEVLNQMVRHDIRNDLQLVSTYTDLLGEHVDDDGREYVEMVQESTQNAIALTKTARDLSEAMLQSEPDAEPKRLRESLRAQVDSVASTHGDADIAIDGSIPSVSVNANDMLDSVFWNILTNAVEHNDKDVPEVTVSATARSECVVVQIADNGPGVPDGQKADIFGKGEKGLESGGTGIGLYLVQTLVDAYGGDVWVEDRHRERPPQGRASADGGRRSPASRQRRRDDVDGSVFVVELPRAD
ncbi:PAS domain S-box protein [Salinibaculum rarum]|uniref:hybrid sensor histidine kinase/response regulator n=1 Tax=Salinibaculum rarum TaxID=3058903 RepID=UPI00265DDEE6|nr:PAS domain S-box protein [Salinibaculum sp. KK48]